MSVVDIYRALWRRKLFILIGTGVLVASAWYFTSRQTPMYESATLVRIQQKAVGLQRGASDISSLQSAERLAEIYAEIIDSQALDVYVEADLRGEVEPVALDEVDVRGDPVQSLDLLWIVARSMDSERARLVADAMPIALRKFIEETRTVEDNIVTVKPATISGDPVSPDLLRNIALAIALGLVFNGAIALLIERLRDPLPDGGEFEATLGRPLLTTVPKVKLARLDLKPVQSPSSYSPEQASSART
jgi:capsular polysaccharide biosynthesis protein